MLVWLGSGAHVIVKVDKGLGPPGGVKERHPFHYVPLRTHRLSAEHHIDAKRH